MGAVLRASGSDFNRVIKTMVLLEDMADFKAMNEVYGGCNAATRNGTLPSDSVLCRIDWPHHRRAVECGLKTVIYTQDSALNPISNPKNFH